MDSQYYQEYEEVQCIGRGNFGAAFLVKNKGEQKEYIAKKIMLGTLSEKEQEGALLEVNLLKNLNHPNIVSYKTSFITQGMLIIIMEYCEVGDLNYHIKRKLANSERFTETEIFNWFVQICLALEYVHGRKVLHRDLKTQNIFLTGNNTVKLGDFGISKVLENTNNVAMTVVGTPYYMSPEVCQNQPYTFKSDVWALGCVLYELCTLKHAFSADNLLGLVYKIVQDKFEDIPECYSKDLSNLIAVLLNKNAQERPSVAQILQLPIVRQKMLEFVQNGGLTVSNKPVYVKNTPHIVENQVQGHQQQQVRAGQQHNLNPPQKQVNYDHLTPKERLQRKKEEEAQRKMEEMKVAARQAHVNNQRAQERKLNEFYAGASQKKPNFYDTVIHNPQSKEGTIQQTAYQNQIPQPNFNPQPSHPHQATNKFEGSMTGADFDANNRTFELSQSMGTQISYLTEESTQNFQSAPQMGSPSKFNSPYVTEYPSDERAITAKGQYDLGDDYNEDFDIEVDLKEITAAQGNKKELNDVIDNYQRILSGAIQQPADSSPVKKEQKENQQEQVQSNKSQMMNKNKLAIQQALGKDMYNHVYDFLKYHRRKGTDEKWMHAEIKNMVNGNRQMMNHCFNLDGIVFMELLNN